ncbi:MAG: hypothetical protein AB9866_10655 [Syntrophobacteraceae bacterium]
MMLKTEGIQLEIEKGIFVCISEGETSHFCEWRNLDSELQQVFSRIDKSLSATLELFVDSKTKADFDYLAEEYKETENPGKSSTEWSMV